MTHSASRLRADDLPLGGDAYYEIEELYDPAAREYLTAALASVTADLVTLAGSVVAAGLVASHDAGAPKPGTWRGTIPRTASVVEGEEYEVRAIATRTSTGRQVPIWQRVVVRKYRGTLG